MDPFIHYGMAAGLQALARLRPGGRRRRTRERVGVNFGSGIGGLPLIESDARRAATRTARARISPFFIPGSDHQHDRRASCRSVRGSRARTSPWSPPAPRPRTASARRRSRSEYGDADVMIAGGAEATRDRARRSAASPRRARCRRATTIRRRRAARGTRTATASCSARAPARWCSRSTSTRRRAARRSTPRSWATA